MSVTCPINTSLYFVLVASGHTDHRPRYIDSLADKLKSVYDGFSPNNNNIIEPHIHLVHCSAVSNVQINLVEMTFSKCIQLEWRLCKLHFHLNVHAKCIYLNSHNFRCIHVIGVHLIIIVIVRCYYLKIHIYISVQIAAICNAFKGTYAYTIIEFSMPQMNNKFL